MSSLRDVALVARFEWVRAVRTWRALALVALYLVASAGGSYLFVHVVWEIERAVAESLGVPATQQVGVMLDQVRDNDSFRSLIGGMTQAEDLDAVLRYPVLAIFHLWLSLILVPFVGATTACEGLSGDMATRAVRFEVVRTGRLELATGRFLGQALLTGAASLVGTVGAWAVGVRYLHGTDPVELAVALVRLTLRGWSFSLAFVGLGVGISQWTANANLARVLAIVGVAATWPVYLLMLGQENPEYRPRIPEPVVDVVLQLLPQGWMPALWTSAWPVTGLVCAAMGYTLVGVGYLRFARRDL